MKFRKSFELALNILLHSKLRSWLTIIGIVIGIGAVVSIIALTQGAEQNLKERLNAFGADILTINPGFSRATSARSMFMGGGVPPRGESLVSQKISKNLTEKDILVIKTIPNVKYVSGEVSGRGTLKYLSKSTQLNIRGVDTKIWKDITTEKISSGRFLNTGDSFSVVLGGDIVNRMFEGGILLNSNVLIEDKNFKVVGILESGNNIYMPIQTARSILDNVGEEEFHTIYVKIEDVNLANETVHEIEKKLMLSRGILDEKNKDFSVINPIERQKTILETIRTMSLFLGAIAAISLLVGGIGIANTMFTAVLERTKDIGILKAIGAKNKDILLIFLINSGLIGFIGGVGGIILGIFGSSLINSLTLNTNNRELSRLLANGMINFELIIGALLFSVLIGMIAGAIPAYRASKLNPVEALRYE